MQPYALKMAQVKTGIWPWLAYLFQLRTRSEKTLQLVKDAATHETVVDIDTGLILNLDSQHLKP